MKKVVETFWPKEIPLVFSFSAVECDTFEVKGFPFGKYSVTEFIELASSEPQIIKVKKLSKVWDTFPVYKKHRTLILDDNPDAYRENSENAIPIETFEGEDDESLLDALRYLELLKVFWTT